MNTIIAGIQGGNQNESEIYGEHEPERDPELALWAEYLHGHALTPEHPRV